MDETIRLLDAVASAASEQRRLAVSGSGSKRAWLPECGGEMLSVLEHRGIVDYQPGELVVTARAGTTLKELNLELGQHDQELAAEPPMFAGGGTVGGAVSAGLSGPARAWRGSLRDAVLGVELINGKAELLRFGGQVMKNVAGYDVSRLVTGAYGALGLISAVSLRVHPRAQRTLTLCFDMTAQEGLDLCGSIRRMPLPLTGTLWLEDRLCLRFSGSEIALRAVVERLGGEQVNENQMWIDARDHRLPFFTGAARPGDAAPLWRVITPPAASLPPELAADACIEWGGGQRWLRNDDAAVVQAYARAVGGWAWQPGTPLPVDAGALALMRNLKTAFDPHAVFASGLGLQSGPENERETAHAN